MYCQLSLGNCQASRIRIEISHTELKYNQRLKAEHKTILGEITTQIPLLKLRTREALKNKEVINLWLKYISLKRN